MTAISPPEFEIDIPNRDLAQWHTHAEFLSQPGLWQLWGVDLSHKISSIHAWLHVRDHAEVYFCGAGTSAFIGETLARSLNRIPSTCRFIALPSTDLVSQPHHFLHAREKSLFVSFGRSGNSPESIGTLDALDQLAPHADRFHIFCNPEGALAQRSVPGPGQLLSLALPSQTHDKGFAMTSSFSTMLLTALASFDPRSGADISKLFSRLAKAGADIVTALPSSTENLRKELPERVVFLGSGPLIGVARESALKILELTAGQIATMWETALGFRHGPKSFVNTDTQIFMFISADRLTRQYELDLLEELRSQFGKSRVFTIGPASMTCDIAIAAIEDDAWSAVLYVLLAQYLAIHWSHSLKLNVDNPFSNGHLTRVVQGVRLHPIQEV